MVAWSQKYLVMSAHIRDVEVRPTEDSDTKQFWKIKLYLFILDAPIDVQWKFDDYFQKLPLHE